MSSYSKRCTTFWTPPLLGPHASLIRIPRGEEGNAEREDEDDDEDDGQYTLPGAVRSDSSTALHSTAHSKTEQDG